MDKNTWERHRNVIDYHLSLSWENFLSQLKLSILDTEFQQVLTKFSD